jgi:hypothetical protein
MEVSENEFLLLNMAYGQCCYKTVAILRDFKEFAITSRMP